jgi:Skp family chaperone for outer membrane proteins
MSTELSMRSLLATLSVATSAEVDEMRSILRISTSSDVPPCLSRSSPPPPPPASVASATSSQTKGFVFEFPAHTEGEPSAADYRFPTELINPSFCLGREVGNEDTRWSTAIYTERQCGRYQLEGCDLCERCLSRQTKYETKPGPGNWAGRIDRPPLDWQHMLGTAWAAKQLSAGKLTFRPTPVSPRKSTASETKSVASSRADEIKAEIAGAQAVLAELNAKKEAEKAKKEAEKAQKAAEKEAEKAQKAAEKAQKAAEKEAEKAQKAAEKAQKEALKEAQKEAEKVRKAEEKAQKEALKKPTVASKTVPKTVKPPPPAVAVESVGTIIQIEDVMYWISNGNVYAYDCGDEKIQEYLGRLTGNGVDIPHGIEDGDEVTVAESVTA